MRGAAEDFCIIAVSQLGAPPAGQLQSKAATRVAEPDHVAFPCGVGIGFGELFFSFLLQALGSVKTDAIEAKRQPGRGCASVMGGLCPKPRGYLIRVTVSRARAVAHPAGPSGPGVCFAAEIVDVSSLPT